MIIPRTWKDAKKSCITVAEKLTIVCPTFEPNHYYQPTDVEAFLIPSVIIWDPFMKSKSFSPDYITTTLTVINV